MFAWLGQNFGWLLVLAGLIALVAVLIVNLVRSYRTGKGSCAGCAGCAYAKSCPSHKPDNQSDNQT